MNEIKTNKNSYSISRLIWFHCFCKSFCWVYVLVNGKSSLPNKKNDVLFWWFLIYISIKVHVNLSSLKKRKSIQKVNFVVFFYFISKWFVVYYLDSCFITIFNVFAGFCVCRFVSFFYLKMKIISRNKMEMKICTYIEHTDSK